MEQERRNTILELHRAGHKPGEIYKLFQNVKGYTRMTIYRVIKRYEKHGLTARRRNKVSESQSLREEKKDVPRESSGEETNITGTRRCNSPASDA